MELVQEKKKKKKKMEDKTGLYTCACWTVSVIGRLVGPGSVRRVSGIGRWASPDGRRDSEGQT